MNWQEILTIVVPLAALLGWVYNRLDRKFDSIDKRFENIDKKFDVIILEIKELRKDLQSLDTRIARIEGQLTPTQVRYWEPKIKEKEEKNG